MNFQNIPIQRFSKDVRNVENKVYITGALIHEVIRIALRNNLLPLARGSNPFPSEAAECVVSTQAIAKVTQHPQILTAIHQIERASPTIGKFSNYSVGLLPSIRSIDQRSGHTITIEVTPVDLSNCIGWINDGTFIRSVAELAAWLDMNNYQRTQYDLKDLNSPDVVTINHIWSYEDKTKTFNPEVTQLFPNFTHSKANKIQRQTIGLLEMKFFANDLLDQQFQMQLHSVSHVNSINLTSGLNLALTWGLISADNTTLQDLKPAFGLVSQFTFIEYEFDLYILGLMRKFGILPTPIIGDSYLDVEVRRSRLNNSTGVNFNEQHPRGEQNIDKTEQQSEYKQSQITSVDNTIGKSFLGFKLNRPNSPKRKGNRDVKTRSFSDPPHLSITAFLNALQMSGVFKLVQ